MALDRGSISLEAKKIPFKTRDEVEIRGTRGGLVILADARVPGDRLATMLRAKLAASGSFFSGATCELRWHPEDLGSRPEEIIHVLEEYGLVLREQDSSRTPERKGSTAGRDNRLVQVAPQPPKPKPLPLIDPDGEEALLFHGVLRSGQVLKHPKHVVVVGHVNPGALVEAGGNVLVLGRLGGTVRAGCPNNRRAIIVAWQLVGGQVAVAGESLAAGTLMKPGAVIVHFRRGRLQVDAWEASS